MERALLWRDVEALDTTQLPLYLTVGTNVTSSIIPKLFHWWNKLWQARLLTASKGDQHQVLKGKSSLLLLGMNSLPVWWSKWSLILRVRSISVTASTQGDALLLSLHSATKKCINASVAKDPFQHLRFSTFSPSIVLKKKLSELAVIYLTLPLTSTDAMRLCSTTGDIVRNEIDWTQKMQGNCCLVEKTCLWSTLNIKLAFRESWTFSTFWINALIFPQLVPNISAEAEYSASVHCWIVHGRKYKPPLKISYTAQEVW